MEIVLPLNQMLPFSIQRFPVLLIPLRISSPVHSSMPLVVHFFCRKQVAGAEKCKSGKSQGFFFPQGSVDQTRTKTQSLTPALTHFFIYCRIFRLSIFSQLLYESVHPLFVCVYVCVSPPPAGEKRTLNTLIYKRQETHLRSEKPSQHEHI